MPRNPNKEDYSGGFPPFFRAFEKLTDLRTGGNTKHHFGEVIFMAFTSILCGVSTFELMEEFCDSNESWFKKWLKLPHGTPSDDTFARIFESINPKVFAECIHSHLTEAGVSISTQQIAIDGKSLRGSSNTEDKHIHSVSAWACEQGLTIAQNFTQEKSNEITAIPELLKLLNIKNCVISIDAIGTQTNIVERIIEQEGDYILSVKANQKPLYNEVNDYFEFASKAYNRKKLNPENWSVDHKQEISRGREESRFTLVCQNLEWMCKSVKAKWENIKSVIMVQRKSVLENGKTRKQIAFYMSSLDSPEASTVQNYIRNHWAIENSCHWVIDTAFKEDANQVSQRNSAKNLSILRRIVLNSLKQAPEGSKRAKPMSLTKKQLRAAQDTDYRERCLFNSP